jgi:hypothetical protein
LSQDIVTTKRAFNGAEFEIKKTPKGERIIVGKKEIPYSNAAPIRKDATAKMIRLYFDTDKLPQDEKELATLMAVEDARVGNTEIGESVNSLGKKIYDAYKHKQEFLNVRETSVISRLTTLNTVAKIIVNEVLKREAAVSKRTVSERTAKKIESKEDFLEDPIIQDWMSDKVTGIGGKATKAKNQFVNALYRVFNLIGLEAAAQFDRAGGAKTEEGKTKWLKQQFQDVVEPFMLKEWAINPVTKKFEKKKGAWNGGVGAHYQAIMAARSFASFRGFPLAKIKKREDPLAAYVRSHGLHDNIEIKLDKIKIIKEKLKEVCEKQGNMDAYLYFMLGLATGMRKTEGLTIPLKPKYIIEIGKFDEEAGKYEGEPFYEIKLFNRKILHTVENKDQAYTESNVYDPETCRLITQRMKEGKEDGLLIGSLNAGAPNNFIRVPNVFVEGSTQRNKQSIDWQADNPVIELKDLPEHEENPTDNSKNITKMLYEPLRAAYIKAGLIEEDKSEVPKLEAILLSKDQKFTVEEYDEMSEAQQKTIMDDGARWTTQPIKDQKGQKIMIPKFNSGYNERNYFYVRPLHSVRHAFAQYWLRNSEWNFAWVAEHGHWKTIEELKTSYGGIPKDVFISNSLAFVSNAAESEGRKLGIDKSKFDNAVATVKEHDDKQQEAIKAAEEGETLSDENE